MHLAPFCIWNTLPINISWFLDIGAAPRRVLIILANIAKLVALEVLADLKVYRVGLIVEDLGLLD
jgi:hypothetical protein